MKLFAILIMLAFALTTANAAAPKDEMRLGGELGLQLPMGDFGDGAEMGFGFNAIFQYKLQPQLYLGGSIGYQSWSGKEEGISFSNIPIMASINYLFPSSGITPFIGAELGLNARSVSGEAKYTDPWGHTTTVSASYSETEFGLNLLGGIEAKINPDLTFRANLKYNIIFAEGSNLTFLGINAGIMYHLGN